MADSVLSEDRVRLAADLYEARRAIRSLSGRIYQERIQDWMRLVRLAMHKEKKPALSACLVLTKHTTNAFDHLWLMAAAVEVIEADKCARAEEHKANG